MSSFEDDVPTSAIAAERAAVASFGGFAGCFLCFLRRQRQRNRSSSKKIIDEATAIAIMAAVERFLDFLCLIMAGTEEGDGVGDGKNGLHGCNGPPQRSRFPAKDDSLNLVKIEGIEPLSLLFETLKLTKLAGLMLGRLPEKPLFSKNRPVS